MLEVLPLDERIPSWGVPPQTARCKMQGGISFTRKFDRHPTLHVGGGWGGSSKSKIGLRTLFHDDLFPRPPPPLLSPTSFDLEAGREWVLANCPRICVYPGEVLGPWKKRAYDKCPRMWDFCKEAAMVMPALGIIGSGIYRECCWD